MNYSYEFSSWFLNEMCNTLIIKEMFFENIHDRARKHLAGLVYCAMLNIYKENENDPNL